MEATGAFYAEWNTRRAGERRDVRRAGLLAEILGVRVPGVPVLTVVGSKGKGTAATYASAWLAASGARVVTVTSPALRRDTERVRVDGAAITGEELAALAGRIAGASASLPTRRAGYLSPSGLFTLAGLLQARTAGADAIVLEAGMGGASDEAGLFSPAVVAITEIFAEHVGVLGDTPAEIAADKAAVATAATSAVVTLPQSPEVARAVETTLARRTTARPEVITPSASDAGPEARGFATGPAPLGVRDGAGPEHGSGRYALPAVGLNRPNAELGCAAGARMLAALGRTAPAPALLAGVLASVVLPGRSTRHRVPGTATEILVDSAIDRTGAAAALSQAYERWGRVDHVLVCLPDHKDVPGVVAELGGLPVTYVRMADRPRLGFTRAIPAAWATADVSELTPARLAVLGTRIVALGTVYFTGRVLDLVDAPVERSFRA